MTFQKRCTCDFSSCLTLVHSKPGDTCVFMNWNEEKHESEWDLTYNELSWSLFKPWIIDQNFFPHHMAPENWDMSRSYNQLSWYAFLSQTITVTHPIPHYVTSWISYATWRRAEPRLAHTLLDDVINVGRAFYVKLAGNSGRWILHSFSFPKRGFNAI